MKNITLLILITCVFFLNASAQKNKRNINKDSLVKVAVKTMSPKEKQQFLAQYDSLNEAGKEFILIMSLLPRSSKKELIKNIDLNYPQIKYLKATYAKLVPSKFTVSIEFKPPDVFETTDETIDMSISTMLNAERKFTQDWSMPYHSLKLDSMLKQVNWNYETLKTIKKLLTSAHCISIENGEPATIGFARGGMGKYSYDLFNHNLTGIEIKNYNKGCEHIFYKRNIVLEYGGGAFGRQCFEK
jgi:hypothetical protein